LRFREKSLTFPIRKLVRKEILHSNVSSSKIVERGGVQNVREISYRINIPEQTIQFQLCEGDFMLFFNAVKELEVPAYFQDCSPQHFLEFVACPEFSSADIF
jgi:hypothetical protein